MIISKLGVKAGFFSELYFTINHYIHCKKHNRTFILDTSNWLYKYKKGWTDYFNPIDFDGDDFDDSTHIVGHIYLFEHFPLYEYMNVLKDIFIYNEETRKIIDINISNYLHKVWIPPPEAEAKPTPTQEYDAIYIRRGDKLYFETNYIRGELYLELLLQKNPNCKNVYLQTDDYNSFLEIQEYIRTKNIDINVFTRCDPSMCGIVNYQHILATDPTHIRTTKDSQEYFKKVQENLKNSKTLDEMTPEEKYEHTIDFLTGVEMLLHSKHCILDKQSNVSRFIWIFHENKDNVYDVRWPDEKIDLQKTLCPAFWD